MTYFHEKLSKTKRAIKPVILDQTVVAGVGNIYADESLFLAKINPQKPANTLNKEETIALHAAIIDVIQHAVERGGSTIRSYVNTLGEAGSFQQELNVYGRTGEPCQRCGTPIKKIKLAQRGTHFCPNCQSFLIEEIEEESGK